MVKYDIFIEPLFPNMPAAIKDLNDRENVTVFCRLIPSINEKDRSYWMMINVIYR